MRKKMDPGEKRSKIIGIKVQPEIFQKLNYIASYEDTSISTYINDLLINHISDYFTSHGIIWNKIPPEEKI